MGRTLGHPELRHRYRYCLGNDVDKQTSYDYCDATLLNFTHSSRLLQLQALPLTKAAQQIRPGVVRERVTTALARVQL